MQYLLLIHVDEALVDALPDGHFDTMMRECFGHADALRDAGHLLQSQQLQPPATGRSIRVRNGQRSVIDGPFAEAKELVAGYTLIQAKSKEEAMEWTRRFPNPAGDGKQAEIEVRQLYELEDFEPREARDRFQELEKSYSNR